MYGNDTRMLKLPGDLSFFEETTEGDVIDWRRVSLVRRVVIAEDHFHRQVPA